MSHIRIKMLLKNSMPYYALIGLMLLGCTSTKKIKQKTILWGANQNSTQVHSSSGDTATAAAAAYEYGFDYHKYISLKPTLTTPILSIAKDSLAHIHTNTAVSKSTSPALVESKSLVADKIVENYLNSENKEPGGHCLSVSKGRFEQAYKQVHGHLPYQDLPDSMASKFHTPKQVFNLLYVSASEKHPEWQSLPEEYRGKGNAGAIAYAGMGTLVDTSGIWNGQLKPGALIQVWWHKADYEKVMLGANVKKLDPYGHSFIFISYVRNKDNEITGLKIADQGFQSYRPLIPRDYEVWWAVNLSV